MATKDITDKQVCEAVAKSKFDRNRYNFEILQEMTGQPEKVCWSAVERADKHGLLEWGVSLGTAWLTDKGKELLDGTN